MFFRSGVILLLGAFIEFRLANAALPSGWKSCKRSDSDRSNCLKEAAQHAVLSIANNGNKKYGVFPADPLRFEKIDVDQSSGPVNIKLAFSNLDVIGLKKVQIENISWTRNEMILNATVPKLTVYGDYDIKGRVLVLPIVGQGKSNITIHETRVHTKWLLPENAKGDKKYFRTEKLGLSIHGSKVTFHFTNLFNGDKRLGDNMNKFLNENWALIWEEVQPAIQGSFGEAVKEISNRIFSKIPSREIAPL
ncbi:JHBP [Nesidiocoris tenuis]|uniref:JHBP n=1 Tax=Nesidiocoris tenuis TaxID=355587 RepID=A0ABN7AER3_9HEMI|nr:JHBP [Nesidiocoris tenuis]